MKIVKFINLILIVIPFIYTMIFSEELMKEITYRWSILFEMKTESNFTTLMSLIILSVVLISIIDVIKNKKKKEKEEKKRYTLLKLQVLLATNLYAHKIIRDNVDSYQTKEEYLILILFCTMLLSVMYVFKKNKCEGEEK